MSRKYSTRSFHKILVPLIWNCSYSDALQAALIISGPQAIRFAGFIHIEAEESLSKGALRAQEMRAQLHDLSAAAKIRPRGPVSVSHAPWDELQLIIQEDQPDLLMLGWPCHFEALGVMPEEVLNRLDCDLSIVRGPLQARPKRILVAIRGGTNAELALRLALSIAHQQQAQITSIHLSPSPN
jgi:nucleotide-binding universal stress UspA family protein